jgi:dTDP-4-amino-4,6-dideoxygalactose transaminase
LIAVPLSRPPVDDEIKKAVLAAIDGRQYILGPECRAFEQELADETGTTHAVLTSSGSAALWVTLRALGVGPGDEVLAPSHTAFPTIEAICLAGATPVFVDTDAHFTLDVADAAARVTSRTVGIVPVHLYGQSADLSAVQELAGRHDLWIVEDCAQAQGAWWQGSMVGSVGRAGAYSFYPSKNLPVMGDGGCIVTSDDALAARCRQLRDHGRLSKHHHAEVGFNFRFNELQAAAARVLLGRLRIMNDHRRALARRYDEGLDGLPLERPSQRDGARHVYHLYVVRTSRRDALAEFLRERGVQTGVHYPVPTHRQPALAYLDPPALPRTERLVDEILSLPISAAHTEAEIDVVIETVRAFFAR